jgi:5-methylcytosine-specific restriction endonuclease McrBC GTP-binding regulatory subunit McrB
LKSKPFVILAGTSGTGKTRLVRLFAEAINAEYKLVSVRPDWSDSSDLFGHVDLNQKFVPGAVIEFVKQAELNPTKPYFLCLDEMNLARVEYYMSDILSAIETRRFDGIRIVTDPIDVKYGNDSTAAGRYGNVILPGNLYIVGTVNMDETTFPFSKKVLDRANTIEFSYVDLLSMPEESFAKVDPIVANNDFLVSDYITMKDAYVEPDKQYIDAICTKLSIINGILETANAHIGYRVRDEIVFYMLYNSKTHLLDFKDAFDNQIMQKILPRVQGSSESIKKMLEELKKFCETEKYESSLNKINFMIKRYEEDGFTSFWL